jgi:type II secretory pathway pseudopilin PulG
MIVIAIIGVLATIAVPNFLTYRNKSRIAAVIGDSEAIRSALAAYAADSLDNHYPASSDITSYIMLRTIINRHGGSLPLEVDFNLNHYSRFSTNGGEDDSYSMRLSVKNMPDIYSGFEILITPTGIMKCTANNNPC